MGWIALSFAVQPTFFLSGTDICKRAPRPRKNLRTVAYHLEMADCEELVGRVWATMQHPLIIKAKVCCVVVQ